MHIILYSYAVGLFKYVNAAVIVTINLFFSCLSLFSFHFHYLLTYSVMFRF